MPTNGLPCVELFLPGICSAGCSGLQRGLASLQGRESNRRSIRDEWGTAPKLPTQDWFRQIPMSVWGNPIIYVNGGGGDVGGGAFWCPFKVNTTLGGIEKADMLKCLAVKSWAYRGKGEPWCYQDACQRTRPLRAGMRRFAIEPIVMLDFGRLLMALRLTRLCEFALHNGQYDSD